ALCYDAARLYLGRDLSEVECPGAFGYGEAVLVFSWVGLNEAVQKVLAGAMNNSIAVGGILAAQQVLAGNGTARDVSEPFDLRPQSIARRRQGPDLKKS